MYKSLFKSRRTSSFYRIPFTNKYINFSLAKDGIWEITDKNEEQVLLFVSLQRKECSKYIANYLVLGPLLITWGRLK